MFPLHPSQFLPTFLPTQLYILSASLSLKHTHTQIQKQKSKQTKTNKPKQMPKLNKKPTKNKQTKNRGVPFVSASYSQTQGLPRSMAGIPSDAPLKNTGSSFAGKYQL